MNKTGLGASRGCKASPLLRDCQAFLTLTFIGSSIRLGRLGRRAHYFQNSCLAHWHTQPNSPTVIVQQAAIKPIPTPPSVLIHTLDSNPTPLLHAYVQARQNFLTESERQPQPCPPVRPRPSRATMTPSSTRRSSSIPVFQVTTPPSPSGPLLPRWGAVAWTRRGGGPAP